MQCSHVKVYIIFRAMFTCSSIISFSCAISSCKYRAYRSCYVLHVIFIDVRVQHWYKNISNTYYDISTECEKH